MDWQEKLIALFLYVNKHYDSELFIYSERMSSNSRPEFSDPELITVYLWGIMNGYRKVGTGSVQFIAYQTVIRQVFKIDSVLFFHL